MIFANLVGERRVINYDAQGLTIFGSVQDVLDSIDNAFRGRGSTRKNISVDCFSEVRCASCDLTKVFFVQTREHVALDDRSGAEHISFSGFNESFLRRVQLFKIESERAFRV